MHYELDEPFEIFPDHSFISLVDADPSAHRGGLMYSTCSLNSWPVEPIRQWGPTDPKTLKTPVLFRLVDHDPIDVRM